MAEFDESKVINSLHTGRAIVGEKYWFSDHITLLKDIVVGCDNKGPMRLAIVSEAPSCPLPFKAENGVPYALLYPYEEPPKKLMSNRQLSEWLAKGNGEWKPVRSCMTNIAFTCVENCSNDPVSKDIVIRPWDSEKWIEPTIDIYERDCK